MTDTPERQPLDRALLVQGWVLMLGVVAPLLDSTIVNVALRTLGGDLHASVSAIQWVGTGYLLALATTIPLTGWAVDRFGAKRMWLAALTVFLVGSVLSGLAWNLGSLIAFRVLQGAGTGLLIPIMQVVLFRSAAGRPLGRLMAVMSLPMLVGPILGPVVGGLIVDHLSWRWIFFVNPPICLVAMVLAWRTLPADLPDRHSRLDVPGLLLLSPGLAALLYGLSQVGELGGVGHARVLLPGAAGAAMVVAFVVHALRRPGPLVDLRLFRDRQFSSSSALLFLTGLASVGAMLLLPLYYQEVRGESVLSAGLLLAPQGLGTLLSRGGGALADRIGPRPVVVAGVLLGAVSTIPFAQAGAGTSLWLLSLALVGRGAGLGLVFMAVMLGAFGGLTPGQVPHASTITRIMQQLGASFGMAVLAVVLQRETTTRLADGAAGVAVAFQHTFVWLLVLTLLAVVPALLLPRARPDADLPREASSEPQPEAALDAS